MHNRLEFLSASGLPVLIFPRRSGALELSFDVRSAAAPFDLGAVRYVGSPAGLGHSFSSRITEPNAEIECEDGIDARTGAVCADDDNEENECNDEENEHTPRPAQRVRCWCRTTGPKPVWSRTRPCSGCPVGT